jgi:hypothetical protein
MERIVSDTSGHIFEMHIAPLRMDDKDSLPRHATDSCLPIPVGSPEGPQGSCERHIRW